MKQNIININLFWFPSLHNKSFKFNGIHNRNEKYKDKNNCGIHYKQYLLLYKHQAWTNVFKVKLKLPSCITLK